MSNYWKHPTDTPVGGPNERPTDSGHTESLLGLAIGYVEAYIGRFPKNVRPEHIAEFRRWRDSHPAHVVIVIHESRDA